MKFNKIIQQLSKKIFQSTFIFLLGQNFSISQTYTTSVLGTTNWNESSNWVVSNTCNQGGYSTPPPSLNAWWPSCPVNIIINRNMTLNGSFISNFYVNSITISNGAMLTITGDLIFEDNTPATSFISVNNGSSLVVNGTFNVNKNLNFPGNLTVGTLTVNSGVTFTPTSVIASSVNVNGTMQVSNSLTVTGTTTINSSNAVLTMLDGSILESNLLNVNSGIATINENAQANLNGLVTSSQSSTQFNNSGSTLVNGNISFNGLVNNYGYLSGVNLIGQGSGVSVFNNFGGFDVFGDVTLPNSSKLNLYPKSVTIIDGNMNVSSNDNLTVGTAVAAPSYTDLVIKGDVISSISGDVIVQQNGRVAVWGNFDATDNSGGTFLRLQEGGQVYVEGDITFTGGGNYIDNKNTDKSYLGLYIGSDSKISFSPNSGSGFIGGFKEGEEYENQNSTNSGYTRLESMPIENNPFLEWLKLQPDSPIKLSPLPVELISFTAICEEEVVLISWSTASENNSSYFEVKKSIDGYNWNTIETVAAAGNSTELLEYSILDRNVTIGNAYYRLNQVDIDGKSELFDVVNSNCDQKDLNNLLCAYPNPSCGEFYVEFNSKDLEGAATINIFDSKGLVVYKSKVQLAKGLNFYTIGDIATKESVYYIHLQSDGFKSNVVKQVIR